MEPTIMKVVESAVTGRVYGEKESSLFRALAKAHLEMDSPRMNSTGQFNNKYANLHSIYKACRKPLAKHGITIQESVEERGGSYWLITTIRHYSGENHSYSMPIFVEKKGTCQGFVSGYTYARRAAITSILSLPQEDDDGNEAMEEMQNFYKDKDYEPEDKNTKISKDQAKIIGSLLTESPELLDKILDGYDVRKVTDLLSSDFDKIKKGITNRLSKK